MPTSNSTLSISDIETLSGIGHSTVENIVGLVVEAILYTIYFGLVVVVGRILLEAKSRTQTSIAIFIIILTMFMLDTAICIIDIHNTIRPITVTLYSTYPESLTDRYASLTLPWMTENALTSFMANLGDVIIIWRTWALYKGPRERWILLIPISLLVGSLTSSSLLAYCVTKYEANIKLDKGFPDAPFCANLYPTQGYPPELASMVLATTAVATAMISWKAWVYRRAIRSDFRLNRKRTHAEKILAVLVESGVLYLMFFVQVLVNSSPAVSHQESTTPGLEFAANVWSYMTNHIIGAYPVLIVIFVRSQRSYIEDAMSTGLTLSTNVSEFYSFSGHHTLPSHRFEQSTMGTVCSNVATQTGLGSREVQPNGLGSSLKGRLGSEEA
ncbi:unnamed protein product [Peniophora sp. CBMAI 1063]|nr:unnamed protein product [Peniophora sp. CBMAI 1063]